AGVKRTYSSELPPEAEAFRTEVAAFLAQYEPLPDDRKRKALAASGYLVPHWPKPWGRAAGAIEQLVIDQEFKARRVRRPDLGISGSNVLTIAQHVTAVQVARWVSPS